MALNTGGVSLVVVAISIFVILTLAALAVDMAYMYYVKNELQVAVDAAALAGAGSITDQSDTVQTAAVGNAIAFAAKNVAGKTVAGGAEPVLLAPSNIEVGFWDAANNSFTSGVTPVNALEVKAEKSSGTFFGKLLGFSFLTAHADAIGYNPPRPTTPISLCIKSCDLPVSPGSPLDFFFKEGDLEGDTARGASWSELTCEKATNFGPDSLIARIIRDEAVTPNVCGQCITTNNAAPGQIMGVLCEEYNKRKDDNGQWELTVAVVNTTAPGGCANCTKQPTPGIEACPPGVQPDEPFFVERYAKVIINAVYANGCTEPSEKPGVRVIDIGCVPCPAVGLFSKHPVLVR